MTAKTLKIGDDEVEEYPEAKLNAGEPFPKLLALASTETIIYWMSVTPHVHFAEMINAEMQKRQLGSLIKSTQEVRNSSHRLETLTERLNGLTWALIALTVLAAAVPIIIEVLRPMSEPVPPIVVQFLQPTVPQTLPRPAP